MVYQVRLPAFEGPLDLLLHLIRVNQVDIYDIPIARITDEYFQYLRMMEELDLEVAGEFLVMAATLVYVKSRMLLPLEPTEEEGFEEDPRTPLVDSSDNTSSAPSRLSSRLPEHHWKLTSRISLMLFGPC
jgi:segregation and condensation protein A